jgi:hypothetical protein
LELGLCRSPLDGVAAKADFSNFPRNVAPDFLQYLKEKNNQGEEVIMKKAIVTLACCALIAPLAFAQYQKQTATTTEPVTVTGTVVKITTEEGAAASYQPAKTLVVRADGSNNPGSYVLKGPGHVVNKAGEVIKTAIKPGARVRVYYANMGDSRVVDHVVVLD